MAHRLFFFFFEVPVTQTLFFHINQGTCPSGETRVTYCSVPCSTKIGSKWANPLAARCEILRRYEAFKEILGGLESTLKFGDQLRAYNLNLNFVFMREIFIHHSIKSGMCMISTSEQYHFE